MKALILAAGMGTRLGKYTESLPKGMLSFNGKPLIEWQIQNLRKTGIDDIIIVTGYKKEAINYPGIKYYHNPLFAETNMVESMLCAKADLNSDILVAYSDILYTPLLVKLCKESSANIGVVVDKNWRDYWEMRYNSTEFDLESLQIKDGKIVELGKPITTSKGIDYRYIGLIKFSKEGIRTALKVYDVKKSGNESWLQSGKTFPQGYMTDLLNEVILSGYEVEPLITEGGWLEFDTNEDYEITCKLLDEGKLASDLTM
jgi:choline kinase